MPRRQPLRSGQLDKQVNIQSKSLATGTIRGTTASGWTNFSTNLWASLEPMRGDEVYPGGDRSNDDRAVVLFKIGIRYLAGVRADMRVVFGLRVFLIKAVINVGEQDRDLELICEEVK